MRNMNKSTGYLIVIVFWLVMGMLFSSCGSTHSTCAAYASVKVENKLK